MIITHKLNIDEAKLGSSVKTNWKLSKVRAIVSKESEKAIQIDTDYSCGSSSYHWIPKSLIAAIDKKEDGVWAGDCFVTLPTWFCIESGFVAEA